MGDGRKRVLIVEDEVLVAMSLAIDLRKAGFDVVDTIASGEEAIGRLRTCPVDVVLMDVGLAGEVDGVEAAVQIRAFSAVPIVFLTGYANRETDPAVAGVGPLGFLVKPTSVSRLETLLESL